MTAKIYAVVVNRDDTVRVVAATVEKETPQFYMIEDVRAGNDWSDPRRTAFGYSRRVQKQAAHISQRAALEAYMTKRQRAKADAQSVIGQATKQIASANELLMREPPEQHEPVAAIGADPSSDRRL